MPTDIFLIRHAEPLLNTGLQYRVMPGPGLSDMGRREARQVAAFLADKGIAHLFVSPFARTTQTAELIVEQLDIPVTFTKLIEENAPTESADQVFARVREFLQSLTDSPLERIALVSHGFPIGAMITELSQGQVDLKQYVFPGNNPAPTGGVWHARRSEQSWRLELVFKPDSSDPVTR